MGDLAEYKACKRCGRLFRGMHGNRVDPRSGVPASAPSRPAFRGVRAPLVRLLRPPVRAHGVASALLLCVVWGADGKAVEYQVRRFPDKPMSDHGLHDWWYACLERAGVVEPGTTSGERMHKARHTAGQRVLDVTGNLKAAQKLLGHSSIQTTGDVYADWDIDQLADTMRAVLEGEK